MRIVMALTGLFLYATVSQAQVHSLESLTGDSNGNIEVAFSVPEILPDTFIFPDDLEDVNATVATIKQNFADQFSLKIENINITPKLVGIDNDGGHFGIYSYHKITFGKLSTESYDKLTKFYKFPFTSKELKFPDYNANRTYQMVEFLVPKIQPLAGLSFSSKIRKSTLDTSSTTSEHLYFTANCWTTLHDVLVSAQEPFTIHGDLFDFNSGGKNVYLDYYSNPNYVSNLVYGKDKFKAYDIFANLLSDEDGNVMEINHIALFVGPDLVFEKVGPHREGYRVGLHYHHDELKYFRNNVKQFPLPQQLPDNLKLNPEVYAFPATVVENEKSGEFILDPQNKVSITIIPTPNETCDYETSSQGLCTNFPMFEGVEYLEN